MYTMMATSTAVIGILLQIILLVPTTTTAPAKSTEGNVLQQKWYPDQAEKTTEEIVHALNSISSQDPSHRNTENDDGVTFLLYTKKNGGKPEILQINKDNFLENTTFDPSRPIKIVIHGWQSSPDFELVQDLVKGYLQRGAYNVITVDWSDLASSYFYFPAVNSVPEVGAKVATVITKILDYQVRSKSLSRRKKKVLQNTLLAQIHILGHSLGAHIAGYAGRSLGAKKVGRITGLDPAGIGFESVIVGEKLSKDDAQFVDIIHTTAGSLGFEAPVGHVDFYPNGGLSRQPGCGSFINFVSAQTCSHSRAYEYFAEAINSEAMVGILCDTFSSLESGKCHGEIKAVMGEDVPKETRGIFLLQTNDKPPFALVVANKILADKNK